MCSGSLSDVRISAYPFGMRVTDLHLPPPSCLALVRTARAEGEFRRKLVEAFISDATEAERRAFHLSLERPEGDYVSTRDELEVWTVGCLCGEDKGKVFGVREGDAFSAPLFHACPACGGRSLIFDPAIHGYNAEIAKRKRKAKKAPNATFAMLCRACKNTVWRPAVIVTYQGEEPEVGPGKKVEDYFDVILVGGQCATCGDVAIKYDAECA